jgi:flagellin-like hook-associated protein FlgL
VPQIGQLPAVEVDGLFKEAISLLNTTYGGRYIFGGFKDNAAPFDPTGTYQWAMTIFEPSRWHRACIRPASLDANAIVKGANGGVDLLQDHDRSFHCPAKPMMVLGFELDSTTEPVDQSAGGRTHPGGHGPGCIPNAVSTAQTAASDETVKIGKLLDADIIDASTRLASAQYALNATLTASAKTLSMSLADKLHSRLRARLEGRFAPEASCPLA